MTKQRLRMPGAVPYGGVYKLNLPEKGMVGEGTVFDQLLKNIASWRRANGWPIGAGLYEEVEQEICNKYPQECNSTDSRVPDKTRRFAFGTVVQATRDIISHKLAGSPLVSDEEANRRAAICRGCPNNVSFAMPCGGVCPELKHLVNKLVGARKTQHDGYLNSCAICKCYLSAIVYIPLDFQVENLTEEQKAQFKHANETVGCWKTVP